ncbi:tetratricopeptide (TPR) repeat protein [Paenarthrobacter nitroguajacolicus]|uniref:CHAT domain-containing protein n=1 Tax=Paenarthrobacter nitroguajacolicus TaxID=211146 RepID=UPI002861965B|nr:CHAT domain-containing protein [Paenarthrobacter nitroguajacolicus]MDR6988442.1 tetratricopeptide (TPR) repeat protein [Paenarthrobacter nitroguajacolicus]
MDCDIELEIDTGSARGEYTVHVVRAPAGGHASGRFSLDVDGILDRLPQLEATVLASAVAARRTMPVAEMAVREVGQELFQALFTREVYGTYRASLGAAQHAGQQLRVVLRLAAPELATMPWETLFDPETETYLCQTEPLLRHVPAPDYNLNPLDVAPPLRILGIVASPRDLPTLDVDAEKDHLGRALAGPVSEGRVELIWAKSGTWDDVQSMLLAGPWHVVHFVGHGDYDSRTDEGRIALVGPDGRAAMVRAVRLMALLSVAAPRPRLVVLNSCSSGEMGQSDLFSGTASALVRSGIGAVAAMQFAISDYAAIAFAHGFYAAIANGRTVDEAARVGRISVMASPDGTLEWVTPALYVRGGTTQLFTLKGAPRAPGAVAGTASPGSTTAAAPAGGRAAGSTPVTPVGGQAAVPAGVPAGVAPTDEITAQALKRAQLRALYVQASAELRARRFEQAVELFEDLLTLEPGYRDATALKDRARHRLELATTYRAALEAEETGDWLAAADGFAVVQDDPEYPEAATRRQDCEHRQRISDLEGELRYHSSLGSWQAVLDVSAELATLDPRAADPDGLAAAARAEIEKARPQEPPPVEASETTAAPKAPAAPEAPEEDTPHGSYTATDPPIRPALNPTPDETKAEAPAGVPASNAGVPASKTGVPESNAGVSAPAPIGGPVPPRWTPLMWGGAALIVAGGLGACFAVYFLWLDDNYWYESGGDASLRVVYGLVAPLGYLLLAVAGLPDRTAMGRAAMAGVIVSGAVFGLSGLNYTVELTAVVASFVHAGFGLWAGILALRSRKSEPFGWLLLWPTVTVPLVWVQDKGVFLESWYRTHAYFALIQLVVVCAAGIGFVVAARRARAGGEGTGT